MQDRIIPPPDGGFGWAVVASSFFIHIFVLGNIYSFGVFFPIYVEVFNANQSSVAWVGSMGVGLMSGLGAVSGSLSDKYGNRNIVFCGGLFVGLGYLLASYSTELWHLYLTQGLIVGIGYSLSFIAGISVVGQWFVKKRGLALGIAVAGSGFGQIIMSLITASMIKSNGWRFTLKILALINTIGLMLCSLCVRKFDPHAQPSNTTGSVIPLPTTGDEEAVEMVPITDTNGGYRKIESPTDIPSQGSTTGITGTGIVDTIPVQEQHAPVWHYFKRYDFTVLYFSIMMTQLGAMMPFVFIPLVALARGISYFNAVFLLSISGICSAIGRVFIGIMADNYGRLNMLRCCMFGCGISTLTWMVCTEYYSMAIYAGVYGFLAGGIIMLIPAVSADQFGTKNLSTVMGLLYTSSSIGNVFAPPIGGFLYDIHHEYNLPIAVAASFMLVGGCINMAMPNTHTAVKPVNDISVTKTDVNENIDVISGNTTADGTADEAEEGKALQVCEEEMI